jgi:ribonuclease E
MTMHVDRVSEGDAVAGPLAGQGDVETVTEAAPPPETIGGDDDRGNDAEDEPRERRIPSRFLRHYKIQEVIRRRQIILVQVVKEERGNKGAALTTYISLPGRFSVLMPNSPKGGGVSRKITSTTDRKRLREVIDEVSLPRGMSIIVRTAGAQRPKPEIRRDCEYLLRLWDDIRERTLSSTAPALVYEEADLLKRSIRDVYGRDVDEIQIEGEEAFRQARDFMRMLMPTHERKIKLYRDAGMPLFARAGVEQQLDAMMSPTVQLRSGGYIVINQTEALVAIDVNSGRATRDRHIEDTALRTNLEAADEIARQLRLRDLAGLIVIDFIDMESSRNDAMVERRLKEALRHDRARIQVGQISHFGLLEMSRQRLRPSLTEQSFITCSHCHGLGIVRSADSAALTVLRGIEEEGAKRRAAEILVHCAPDVAMHILNHKRERLSAVEDRFAMCVLFEPDATMTAAQMRIDRLRPQTQTELPSTPALRMDYAPEPVQPTAETEEEEDISPVEEAEDEATGTAEAAAERANGRRKRRRRRGGRREDGTTSGPENGSAESGSDDEPEGAEGEESPVSAEASEGDAAEGSADSRSPEERGESEGDARRRRGRRGGRRRREGEGREGEAREGAEALHAESEERPESKPIPTPPRYAGPTPADPFAGSYDHLLDAMDAAEAAEAAAPRRARNIPIAGSAPEPSPESAVVPSGTVTDQEITGEAPAEAAHPAEPSTPDVLPEPALPVAEAASEPPAPEPEPEPEPTAAEPVVGATVQPVVLGTTEAAAAPAKRGWWRR